MSFNIMNRPPLQGMLELGLYVKDVSRSIEFYCNFFGFSVLMSDERFAALDVEGKQILLLFKQGSSAEPIKTPWGMLPGHDGEGTTHLAFSIKVEDVSLWEGWLDEKKIEIESKISWEKGGRSLYFRDPDGHLLELATPGTWATY